MKKKITEEQEEFLNNLASNYGDMLTKYAYRFFAYRPHLLCAAQDAVQDTFEKAVKHVDKLMMHPNKIGWLKVSLRNTLLNFQRSKSCQKAQLGLYERETSEETKIIVLEAFDRMECYPQLEEAISVAYTLLTEEETLTFNDYFLCGLTAKESALIEEVSLSTIQGRIKRIRKKMRDYFGISYHLLFVMFYILCRR